MTWIDAEVEVQGESLVVKDKETGSCLVVDVNRLMDYNPHVNANVPYDKLEAIFGEEVFH